VEYTGVLITHTDVRVVVHTATNVYRLQHWNFIKSEHNIEDLLLKVLRWYFRLVSFFDGRDALVGKADISKIIPDPKASTYSDKVHLVCAPESGALVNTPSRPEDKEEWNIDVSSEEVGGIPCEEHLETID